LGDFALSRAILIVIAVAAAAGCERKPPPPVGEAPAVIRPHVVVLAADILVIDGKHVKLSNAFGPEPVPDARCWAEALAAKQAVRTVAAMVERAASVQAHPTGGVDEYNRTLAKVDIDGADLGETLFKEGIAARPPGKRFEWCGPISRNDPGSPNVLTMMELAPGPAPGK
jgi:endonuclease YncB( thermonuclease family)